ncbi:MAG: hypothetical protein JXQ73_11900 [Phycisphaerae bacterium]|nr:hypothetical protein [Phycisphaerae bacterium]
MKRKFVLLAAALLWPLTSHVSAEGGSQDKGSNLWNIQSMVTSAAEQIIRRYKLNDDQAEYTRKLMARRVNNLLEKHDEKIRSLFREAIAMRAIGKAPSVETIQSWAERALPVYQDAKKEILAGNKEWAEILTPEQKKIHDLDLRMMEVDFKQYEERLTRWKSGGFEPKKDWVVQSQARRRPMPRNSRAAKGSGTKEGTPVVKKTGDQPATPTNTPPPPSAAGPPRIGLQQGQTPKDGQDQQVEVDPDHFWDVYVRDFVRKYRLDEGQRKQAEAILKDCKAQAQRHRTAHVEDYRRLHAALRKNRGDAGANEELGKLDAPINDLFEELKQRLDKILTSEQIRKVEQSEQK